MMEIFFDFRVITEIIISIASFPPEIFHTGYGRNMFVVRGNHEINFIHIYVFVIKRYLGYIYLPDNKLKERCTVDNPLCIIFILFNYKKNKQNESFYFWDYIDIDKNFSRIKLTWL